MARRTQNDVIARYGNWYHGSSDLFAHCLVLRSGLCLQLFQGLQMVTVRTFKAPVVKLRKLLKLLKQPIPAAWPHSSYVGAGYNFITDAQGASAKELAVYGIKPGDTLPPGEYYVAPPNSEIGQLVKAIAKVD